MSFDYAKYAGAGTKDLDKRSLGMPMLNIIQKGSPQFDETHRLHAEKKIEGCKPGQMVFNPTNSIIKPGTEMVIVGTQTVYTEWKPKTSGGGLVSSHGVDIVGDKRYRRGVPGTPTEYKEWLGENELVYTMYFSILFKEGSAWTKGILSFTSKQLKKARLLNKKLMSVKIPDTDSVAPIFASLWSLNTVPESNDKGGWFAFDIKHLRLLDAASELETLTQAASTYEEGAKALMSSAGTAALPAGTTLEESDIL